MKPVRQPFLTASLWIAFGLWIVTICILSSMSGPQLEPAFELISSDKLAHFLAFAVGGVLLALALGCSGRFARRTSALLAFSGVALFGALDEWHQTFTPQRSGADVGDWIADVFGAAAGAGAVFYFHGKISRRRPD